MRFLFCISVVFISLTLLTDLTYLVRYSTISSLTGEFCDLKSQGGFFLAEAKGMWGSRRKKKDKDKDSKSSPGAANSDKEMEALYEELISRNGGAGSMSTGVETGSKRKRRASISSRTPAFTADMSESLSKLVEMYLSAIEQLLDSDQFDRLANPEALKRLVDALPAELLSAYPQVSELLAANAELLSDPEQLRAAAKEALQSMRAYTDAILAAMADPRSMEAFLQQLPDEVRTMAGSLMQLLTSAGAGSPGGLDVAALTAQLQGMVEAAPGLDEAQRRLARAVLSGDMATIMGEMRKAMADPQQVELARQGLAANPALLQALGLPADTTSDPQQWASLVQSGVDSFLELTSPATSQATAGEEATDSDLEAMLQTLLKKSARKTKTSEEETVEEEVFSRAA